MPDKRKDPSSESSSPPYPKRPRPTDSNDDEESYPPTPKTPTTARIQPKNDPVYGQRHAFPGLDDLGDEDQLCYDPPEDGIEYLRMVRSEARTLPAIFVSNTVCQNKDNSRTLETQGNKSSDDDTMAKEVESGQTGFYSDGVYVAYYSQNPQAEAPHTSAPDAQEIYYNLLHHRFLLLRSTLKCTPPASVIASLGAERPISLPRSNKHARAEWEKIIQTMDPRMAQLACMDMESVLGLLAVVARLLSKTVRGNDSVQVKRLGAWAWGLLGRCRAVGEMGSEEVGDIRELGKRAARILVKIRESEVVEAQGLEGEFDMEDGERGEVVEENQEEREEKGVGTGESINRNGDGGDNQVNELDITNDAASADGILGHEEANGDIITSSNGVDTQDELEAAKARLQARLQAQHTSGKLEPGESEIERENNDEEDGEGKVDGDYKSRNAQQYTRAMLDMIISVIGEFYGQRDLLEFRDIWEEDIGLAW
ncbi:hypothetical protein I7I51_00486 [Histoplasma capsulatum]|uniref:Uncharacterized protein n=1 Tax=Ajellomyces capsulatus TaxID=5037 RepID=A0A8A1MA47_AJECA|nr:hypothetical protein I7I51_00486 [Histoplasma capsulatum]